MGTGIKRQANESGAGYEAIDGGWENITETTRGINTEQYDSKQSTNNGESSKRRGRPKGSTNKPKDTVVLQQEETKEYQKDVNRFKKKSSKNVSSDTEKMYTAIEANDTTQFIIGMIDEVGGSLLGETGKLNLVESSLIAMSLPKYLTSIKKETIENATNILAPILMLTGLSLYGMRVGTEILERRKINKHVDRVKESMKSSEELNTESKDSYNTVEVNEDSNSEDIWQKHMDLNGNIKSPL